ncbi:GNAT family N-acetyltransferase [Mucilaginibacter sp. SMC90]|uniref:GNAT family N-acetyltransferase n=1 Tax=Mucilaginibacter sp. SMC90 TaxID=2929803 RepID=UPI001FB354AD|nr:GNAT family N-acetyltransferase [Mucilaginibacter sp. SMC90]UOE51326.1 GNAT family N-acetyltransferase [Mucilaginibacter sp. SMC90]
MLEPVHIDHKDYFVHAFRPEDIQKESLVSSDILAIFSDKATTRYLPGKKLRTLKQAEAYFRGNLLSYHAGKNFLHFIREKQSGSVIGLVDLISPEVAREHYRLDHYPYFIEFYLKSEYHGRRIMGKLLPEFLKQLKSRDIKSIGAVVNQGNTAAQKVVTKAGFSFVSGFDLLQDLYISTLN